jgi:NADPH:quinone reductase-like Zn-dependent oxidoreductase
MKQMETMKAIVATGYGSPEVLKLGEVILPTLSPDEILVKVHSSTVTRADAMMRTGKPWFGRLMIGLTKPKHPIPGTGFAGVLEAVGSKVRSFKPGDRVFGETTTKASTNAEYVAVKAGGVVLQMPDHLAFDEAATFTDGPLTSLNFLKKVAGIQKGERVLVNGASGSLGTAAVQLAKALGAEVTGVSGNRNVGLVKSLGADFAIDYTKQDFTLTEKKYHVIYDTVGTTSFGKAKKALTSEGRFVSPVFGTGLLLNMVITSFLSGKKAVFAATGLRPEEELRTMLKELVDLYANGDFKVIIDRTFPLEKVPEAHRYVDAGHKKGNVIIHH